MKEDLRSEVLKLKAHDIERPLCTRCYKYVRVFIRFSPKDGRPTFKKLCRTCSGARSRQKPHLSYMAKKKRKTMMCEKCGFKAEYPCQLDIDHVDGNHDNNNSENLQILCANCHRIKTKLNKDGPYRHSKR